MKSIKKSQGFTLTEILVVVLIIAVLSAIVYPLYTKVVTKSRAVEAINLLEMVRSKQLQNFAKKGEYLTNFSSIENITSNVSDENNNGETIKVKEYYTLSLNNEKRCAMANYEKGGIAFTFSSSYENAGLGCTGDICSSFGNIVGSAADICGCSNTCGGGFTRNESSCECECNSCIINGQCTGPVQTEPETQSCGNGGTQSRVCVADCNGGTCGAWGPCTGQGCEPSLKPATTQACGNCGTQTRTVTCNTSTGGWQPDAWGACTGAGECAPNATKTCAGGGTQTCNSSCSWNACVGAGCVAGQTKACGNCGTQTCGSDFKWGNCKDEGVCSPGETEEDACDFNPGYKATRTCLSSCTWGTWIGCPGRKKCSDSCPAGQKRDTSIIYEDEGKCCVSACDEDKKNACENSGGTFYSADCSCKCPEGYFLEGNSCKPNTCDESTKPATTQACGNCNKGTQTRTVTCNTTNKTWTKGEWGACTGGGICAAGAKQTCKTNGTSTCSASCTWGDCVCPEPFVWSGGECVNQPVKVGTRTINILVQYSFVVISTNYQACYGKVVAGSCPSVESKTYYNGGTLAYDQGSMQGPSMCGMGAEGTDGHFTGWQGGTLISAPPSCPSGTNQSICASNCTSPGCKYECILSESYSTQSSPYYERRCISGSGYNNTSCEQDNDIGCNDDAGTATVLTCSR